MAFTLGIIGYGGMGSWHHRNIAEKVPEICVKGAFDIREEAMAKAVQAGLHPYESLEAMLSDPAVDLVTVATPNDSHKPISIAALRSGKHVVCEKPVTLSARDLEDIIAVSKEAGKLFSIHQNRRWDKDYRTVKTVLDAGTIGSPYFIESKVQGSRRSLHGWRGHKLNGGGMLLDWGVHLLDQMLDLIDSPVVSVDAHLMSIFTSEVDDNIKLFLRFENGVSALLEMATNCLIAAPRWHVTCKEGTMVVEDWDGNGRIVQLKNDGVMQWADDIVYTSAGPTRTMAPRPAHTTRELPLPDVEADWATYYKNIAAVIAGEAELLVKPGQALRVMRVIELLFASHEEGCGKACRV